MKTVRALFFLMLLLPSPARATGTIPLPPTSGFVPNRGQAPAEVLYYAAGPASVLYLTRDAIVIDRWRSERVSRAVDDPSVRRHGRVVSLRFAGSTPRAAVEGDGRLEPRMNYFLGKDPAGWQADVPVFSHAVYRNLWPGIDLVISSRSNAFAAALDVGRGSDPGLARFELEPGDGTGPVELDIAGVSRFLASLASGDTSAGGAGGAILANPATLAWSTFIGGTSEEIGWAAATDSHGNPIITGFTISTAFPTTVGAYDRIYSGLGDVFVAKLAANGSSLLWSTFLGGTSLNPDYAYAVTVDAGDNPVVTGYTRSEDFPATPGAWDTDWNGEADVFVTKLSASGSSLLWSTFIGGISHDIGYALDLDSSGNVIVAGRSLSVDFPTTPGAYDQEPSGEEDAFVLKLTASGNLIVWCSVLGGSLYDGAESMELDASDSPVLCGYTASYDFPGGSANGLYDIFAARFSPDGSALTWVQLLGGNSYDYGTGLALDSHGNAIICGSTGSSDFPVTAGAYDESYNGDDDVVCAKLRASDGAVQWATFIGGSTPVYEIAHAVIVDAADRPILAGATPSTDFPTTTDGFDTTQNGMSDVFVLRLDASGSALEWSSFFGGPGDEYAFALAKTPAGDPLVTGWAGVQFPITTGAYDVTYNGDISDVFVARLAMPAGATTVSTGGGPGPMGLTVSPNPATGSTHIAFTLSAPAPTTIEVFDAQGRRRALLHPGSLESGAHTVDWNAVDGSGRSLPSGVYAVRVTAGDSVQSGRVVLIR